MMKKILISTITAFTIGSSLVACVNAPVSGISSSEIAGNQVKATQMTIDNANAAIAAVSETVYQGYFGGSINKSDAIKYATQLEEAARFVDQAEYLLSLGKQGEAMDKVKLADTIIQLLESKLVELSKRTD